MSDDGRSPLRSRQLHDLRLLPTATDPRPTFYWSAESPRDLPPGPGTEFPKLLWHAETGTEITVRDRMEQDAKLANGYVLTSPAARVVDPVFDLSEALNGLSADERDAVLEAQRQTRMSAIQARIAALPDVELERLMNWYSDPNIAGATKKAKKTA